MTGPNLPHTRGDEPLALEELQSACLHLPHTRGDEPSDHSVLMLSVSICPTRVGMNRV